LETLPSDQEYVLCASLDLGRASAEAAAPILAGALNSRAAGQGLLHKFRNPEQLSLSHPGWLVLDAVKGPAAYWRVWVQEPSGDSAREPRACFDEARSFHNTFHAGYRECLSRVQAGERAGLEQGLRLGLELEAHMAWEEAHVFPELTACLRTDRVTRELGYEHQGLRAALARWSAFLESCLQGQSTRKQIESFELDLLHLFEHHVEREEQAIYPILEHLLDHATGEA
jgi:hypothetical protein